jgi:hypothetical protein
VHVHEGATISRFVEEAEMNAHSMNFVEQAPIDRAWNILHDRVSAIAGELGSCQLDMNRMGALYPYRTFPETRMVEIADRFDRLAAEARDMVARAAALRQERAA